MPARSSYDAVVIGSGPNGLSAAVVLARQGFSVLVLEARDTVGGGARSAALTLPGYVHDVCSAIHPLGVGSPLFRSLPLQDFGLEWVRPPAHAAHPLDGGTAALAIGSAAETAARLGVDGAAYKSLMGPLAESWDQLAPDLLSPLGIPRHPVLLVRFGLRAMRSALSLAETLFSTPAARALFGGMAAHSIQPLEYPFSAAFGLVLGVAAHAVGWPFPRGGSQKIADALAAYLKSLGGEIVTGRSVGSLDELPPSRVVLFDVSPRCLVRIAGDHLPGEYRQKLEAYRYGPAAFKVDWALDGPIPWAASECALAGTVHVGGALPEICASERSCWDGRAAEKPFVLVAQQSLFDSTRAPEGKHTAWGYCHVPLHSTEDMTARIEAQIERFAPGFRDRILARSILTPFDFEHYNPNYVGGDISDGSTDLLQLFGRPVLSLRPYATPNPRLYLCSAATPPGAGVHGMCGFNAAMAAIKRLRLSPRR